MSELPESQFDETRVREDGISKPLVVAAMTTLALKLRLEKRLSKKLKTVFNRFTTEISKTYGKYGYLPMYDEFRQDVEDTIAEHYVVVGSAFDDFSRIELGIPTDDVGFNKRLSDIIKVRLFSRANQSSHRVAVTTEKDVNKALRLILAAAALEGFILSRSAIAKQLRSVLSAVFGNRIGTISATETAYAAERTKVDEIESLYEMNVALPDGSRMDTMTSTKTWVARFINTRAWHEAAHGQIRKLNTPYLVDGELLMHPLDESLGATARNVINCYCSSMIETKKIPT